MKCHGRGTGNFTLAENQSAQGIVIHFKKHNKYMKRFIEKVIKNINIVKSESSICLSINNNDRGYYAQEVSSRMLDVKRYKV
jgi:hypothetical protein